MAIQYERAPITEALIDIRIEIPDGVTLAALEGLHDHVQKIYPGKAKHGSVRGQFSVGEEVAASATQKDMGFVFRSADGTQIFQARLDGFTFSRLRPYGNWMGLRDEARRLWEIYRGAVPSPKIKRVAVRYINQVDIPSTSVDYKDYFRTTPEVSPDLPQGLSGFFMELHLPQIDFGGMLVLRQASVPPPTPNLTSVILDLDVFRESTEAISEDEVWELLEKLRKRKNDFFEGSITDRARELFGKRREY